MWMMRGYLEACLAATRPPAVAAEAAPRLLPPYGMPMARQRPAPSRRRGAAAGWAMRGHLRRCVTKCGVKNSLVWCGGTAWGCVGCDYVKNAGSLTHCRAACCTSATAKLDRLCCMQHLTHPPAVIRYQVPNAAFCVAASLVTCPCSPLLPAGPATGVCANQHTGCAANGRRGTRCSSSSSSARVSSQQCCPGALSHCCRSTFRQSQQGRRA